jgi:hypothetical protein
MSVTCGNDGFPQGVSAHGTGAPPDITDISLVTHAVVRPEVNDRSSSRRVRPRGGGGRRRLFAVLALTVLVVTLMWTIAAFLLNEPAADLIGYAGLSFGITLGISQSRTRRHDRRG